MAKESQVSNEVRIGVDEVVWREDLYPRIEADNATIEKYMESLDVLPPILVNQRNELIDGYHRWTAHRREKAETIAAVVEETSSDADLLRRAIETNAKHGLQLSRQDKTALSLAGPRRSTRSAAPHATRPSPTCGSRTTAPQRSVRRLACRRSRRTTSQPAAIRK